MDASHVIAATLAAGLLGYGGYARLRALRLERANVRSLRRLAFRRRRLLPWAPLAKVLYRPGEEDGVVIEHCAVNGDTARPYTRIAFFGSSCIPAEDTQRLNAFPQASDFSVYVAGFRAVLHHPSFDVIVASTGFADVMEVWLERFAALHLAHAHTPRDAACGACGMSTESDRARCVCGAVYHLGCADAFEGECLRWECLKRSTRERSGRLVEVLHMQVPI